MDNYSTKVFTVAGSISPAAEWVFPGVGEGKSFSGGAEVFSVSAHRTDAYTGKSIGFKCPVQKNSKSFTINAVATTLYNFFAEKALHFATVVSAVVVRTASRWTWGNKVCRPFSQRRKITHDVLLCRAGGLRL